MLRFGTQIAKISNRRKYPLYGINVHQWTTSVIKYHIDVGFFTLWEASGFTRFTRDPLHFISKYLHFRCFCYYEQKTNFDNILSETVAMTYEPAVQTAVLNTALCALKN